MISGLSIQKLHPTFATEQSELLYMLDHLEKQGLLPTVTGWTARSAAEMEPMFWDLSAPGPPYKTLPEWVEWRDKCRRGYVVSAVDQFMLDDHEEKAFNVCKAMFMGAIHSLSSSDNVDPLGIGDDCLEIVFKHLVAERVDSFHQLECHRTLVTLSPSGWPGVLRWDWTS